MGRDTIITQDFCNAFCDMLEDGHTITHCCEELGVTQSHYYQWKSKAKE